MGIAPNDDPPTPTELRKKFGDEAETYAEVRAEAADASGSREASDKWQELASKLRDEEAGDPEP